MSVERSSPPITPPPAIALLRSTLPREGKLPASPWASGSRAPVLLLGTSYSFREAEPPGIGARGNVRGALHSR